MGAIGPDGPKGVGPPIPTAFERLGTWPEGGSWTSDAQCKGLGIRENLGGLCVPLCEREECNDKEIGFVLRNQKGLRFGGYSFDDNHIEKGNNQPRNICALARYGTKAAFGDKATVEKVALDTSYGVTDAGVVEPHWYGNCANGDKDQEKCCTNSVLMQGKPVEWDTFAHGNQCTGDSDTDGVMVEVHCIYDQAKYDEFSKPREPRSELISGEQIVSNAFKRWQTTLQSPNKRWAFKIDPESGVPQVWDISNKDSSKHEMVWDGKLGGRAGPKPYTLKFVGEGTVAVLNGEGDAIWQRGMKASKILLSNEGNLEIYANDGGDKLVWDRMGKYEKDKPKQPPSRRL